MDRRSAPLLHEVMRKSLPGTVKVQLVDDKQMLSMIV